MANKQRQGQKSSGTGGRHGGQKHSSGGIKKNRGKDKHQKKGELRKAKAHAPTADELDNELMKYMGNEFVAKKLDSELDAYFRAGETENQ